jgi:putative oxidoreductase
MTSLHPDGLRDRLRALNRLGDRLPYDLVALALRVFPASVFWASGRTKVEGWHIADSTWVLFQDDYALPLIPPALAAVLATLAEHVLAAFLVLGFLTRLSALGLLAMTLVIQTFVFPGAWMTHGLWAACFLGIIRFGPGALSADRLLGIDAAPGAVTGLGRKSEARV